jgi:hypothetical protein
MRCLSQVLSRVSMVQVQCLCGRVEAVAEGPPLEKMRFLCHCRYWRSCCIVPMQLTGPHGPSLHAVHQGEPVVMLAAVSQTPTLCCLQPLPAVSFWALHALPGLALGQGMYVHCHNSETPCATDASALQIVRPLAFQTCNFTLRFA